MSASPLYLGGPFPFRNFRGQTIRTQTPPKPSPKNVLIINSGGNCRGYNEINYGAYKRLTELGYHVWGALNGPASLTNPVLQAVRLTNRLMSQLEEPGELLLGTGPRGKGPLEKEKIKHLPGNPKRFFFVNAAPFLGGLLFVGGEGTATMAYRLYAEEGFEKILFAGASMDGDIPGQDGAVGMESSVNYAAAAIRAIRRTALTCNKLHIVQTMGGTSGRFPLEAAIRANERYRSVNGEPAVDAVILPEMGTVLLEKIYPKLFDSLMKNRGAILVIGEAGSYVSQSGEEISFKPNKGVYNSMVVDELEKIIRHEMNLIARQNPQLYSNLVVDTRHTTLGHPQREPAISKRDIRLGLDTGYRMVEALHGGNTGTLVPFRRGKPISLKQALSEESRRQSNQMVLERLEEDPGLKVS